MSQLHIDLLEPAGFDDFLLYLNDHLSDNGQGDTAYFQPLPRADSRLSADKADAFRTCMQTPLDAPGWRRFWLARTADGRIAGHLDLRAHPERYATHRCVLGMGVDRAFRQLGLGGRLIDHAAQWARASAQLAWIDLQVLSVNAPAIRLYQSKGFEQTGEITDLFRIDGNSFAFTGMSKRLETSL
ncbi:MULTISPECIES: GNAT family N-acetyltransferase [unclassified Duganella]|uniref:GNAT family N-acetyltransferase n=1 Tax=unclassified Duganella TaxID=2636909 RepID=UPI000E351732|nr:MULTISPECIES: GNAT family N-acetyltransferase [unclassified Duganella]RFP15759.1 GNAT family N-acetyltransferase [Duganella sp. BJB475]RFP33076.1 GNAT family N-acetyltransferase [Duganella sp. BJB476]